MSSVSIQIDLKRPSARATAVVELVSVAGLFGAEPCSTHGSSGLQSLSPLRFQATRYSVLPSPGTLVTAMDSVEHLSAKR